MYSLTSTLYATSSSMKYAQGLPWSSQVADPNADFHIWQSVAGFIARDPQDLRFTFARFAVAHGLHCVDQTGLRIEAHDKILDLILERHE